MEKESKLSTSARTCEWLAAERSELASSQGHATCMEGDLVLSHEMVRKHVVCDKNVRGDGVAHAAERVCLAAWVGLGERVLLVGKVF